MMTKGRVKQGFYILLLSAIAYVMLMVFSLDNTHVIEGLTQPLTSFTGQENEAQDMSEEASTDEVAFKNDIDNYRKNLDSRLKNLKTSLPDNIMYNTTAYTSIMWATLATVLLFVIFTEMER
jgi:hypothetical protein